MKTRNLLKMLLILSIIGLVIGCGSKEIVKEEPVAKTEVIPEVKPEPKPEPIPEIKPEPKPEPEPVPEPKLIPEPEPVPEPELIPEPEPVPEPELIPEPEPVPELPDSVTVMYMTKPNDWLSKIAISEYGEVSMWRSIWKWNYEEIGDNPNLIYPYKELNLKKPREEAKEIEYELVDYTVKQGETLWSIAKDEYGNNYAWIVILRDNYDLIGTNPDSVDPGTILKLRTKLY